MIFSKEVWKRETEVKLRKMLEMERGYNNCRCQKKGKRAIKATRRRRGVLGLNNVMSVEPRKRTIEGNVIPTTIC